ncbi:UNVERIFIED_CONTAM: hypothetical protein FKN15_065765 [Acipenser sinensis]
MDTFFRRHFKKKNMASCVNVTDYCRHRRPSVAVPSSKARRRSSAGLPSANLMQRRRSSVQIQGLPLGAANHCPGGSWLLKERSARRRSSTTTPCLNPRFAVRRKRGVRLRTIDRHLLGPSMLLASLIQMTEEGDSGFALAGEGQVKVRREEPSRSDSEGDSPCSSCGSDRDNDSERSAFHDSWSERSVSDREFEDSAVAWPEAPDVCHSLGNSKPLIRAPRCLRRNSSHLLPAEALFYGTTSYGLYGKYRRTSQGRCSNGSLTLGGRRISALSKAGSPWPGRGVPLPSRRSSVAARRASVSLYRNCSPCWRHSTRRSSLSLLQGCYYDPRHETWSGFLSKAIAKSGLQHLVAQPCTSATVKSDPEREIRSTADWSENALYGEHIWFETNVSGDFCYVGEQNCIAKALQKSVPRKKCAACKIVVHTPCIEQLEKGFQQKFAFHSKEIVAISCSWCKQAYHNKVTCFMLQQIEEPCSLGAHAAVIVPPTWIIRVRRAQTSLKASKKKKRTSFKRKSSKKGAELPLDVFNNYFSLGFDAHVTLEFHESREANPEKFNSRFRNKMFYAGTALSDFLMGSSKDLAKHIKVVCDGTDLTSKIQDLKLQCLVFLNIPRYCAGTMPWGNPSEHHDFEPQRLDDGCIEVIGFTMTSLVDGEPCKLSPSIIRISLRNQANMVQKTKRRTSIPLLNDQQPIPERLRIRVNRISMHDYEALHYEKEKLKEASIPMGIIVIPGDSDLEMCRSHIERLQECKNATTADRFYRIDRAQEHLNYVTEISQDELFILDPELVITETVGTSPGMPDLVDSSGQFSGPGARHFAFPSSSSSPPSSPVPRKVMQHSTFKLLFFFLFVATTADRFYRIDRAQEHLNYVTEISQDELFILDPELVITETVGTSPGMPDLVDSSGQFSGPGARHFAFPSSSSSPPSSPVPSPTSPHSDSEALARRQKKSLFSSHSGFPFPVKKRIQELQKASQRKRISSDSSVAEALAHSESLRSTKPPLSRTGPINVSVHRSKTTAADFKPSIRIQELQKASQRKRISSDSSVAEALAHSESLRSTKPPLSSYNSSVAKAAMVLQPIAASVRATRSACLNVNAFISTYVKEHKSNPDLYEERVLDPQSHKRKGKSGSDCSEWVWGPCVPNHKDCGAGSRQGTCQEETKKLKCRVPCNWKKDFGADCKYKFGRWGECDTVTGVKNRSGILKKAMYNAECLQTIQASMPCSPKTKSKSKDKGKGKSGSDCSEWVWGPCVPNHKDCGAGSRQGTCQEETKKLKCRVPCNWKKDFGADCKYKFGRWGECDTVTGVKNRSGILKKAMYNAECLQTIQASMPCSPKTKSKSKDVLEAVTSAMKSNVNCVEVQLRACRILQLLFVAVLEHSMEEEWMSSEKVISTVLDVVRTHSTNQELLALALNVLMILSGNGG